MNKLKLSTNNYVSINYVSINYLPPKFKYYEHVLYNMIAFMCTLVIKIVWSYIIADLISGIFHWIEDSYFTTDMKFELFRNIARDNQLHHYKPQEFTKKHWFKNIEISSLIYIFASIIIFIYSKYMYLFPDIFLFSIWWLYLTATITLFSNLIHRWSHINDPPKLVSYLQKLGIIQTNKHHHEHHILANKTDIYNRPLAGTHYCIVTNILNPLLEKVRFWRYLEYVLYLVTKIEPTHENLLIINKKNKKNLRYQH